MAQKTAPGMHKSTQNRFFGVQIPGLDFYSVFLSLNICKSQTDFGSQGFNYFHSRCTSEIFFQILLKLKELPQNRAEHT